ncbi:MAG: hypothetical protein U5K79_22475 [Cyclobacteriaceae bacterium]|nr:hypothetical protein [Cyclobacteriaceae bacterium]
MLLFVNQCRFYSPLLIVEGSDGLFIIVKAGIGFTNNALAETASEQLPLPLAVSVKITVLPASDATGL